MSDLTFALLLVAAGVLIALLGRRLLWLSIGAAGFALGYVVTQYFVGGMEPLVSVLIGALFGVVFAVIALRGFPLVTAALGAVLMALAASSIVSLFSDTSWLLWVVAVAGAVAGWFLVNAGVKAALTALTVLAGGALVARGLITAFPDWPEWIAWAAGVATAIAGLFAQTSLGDEEPTDVTTPVEQ